MLEQPWPEPLQSQPQDPMPQLLPRASRLPLPLTSLKPWTLPGGDPRPLLSSPPPPGASASASREGWQQHGRLLRNHKRQAMRSSLRHSIHVLPRASAPPRWGLGLCHCHLPAPGRGKGLHPFVHSADALRVLTAPSSVPSVAQSCLTVTPRAAARQAFPSITNSWSLLKLTSIESVMPSNHLILCHPLFLLPSIFPTLGSFPMSQYFTSGGRSIGDSASASVLPMNIHDYFLILLTCLISFQSKGLSRVFSNTAVQKHQFFGAQFCL